MKEALIEKAAKDLHQEWKKLTPRIEKNFHRNAITIFLIKRQEFSQNKEKFTQKL